MKNAKRKNNILTIMKKELRRFFGDRRMLATILLPGILIYVVYSLMGDAMMSSFVPDDEAIYIVQFEQMPASVEAVWLASEIKHEMAAYATREEAMEAVRNQTLDMYVIFPENFDEQIMLYDPTSGQPAPAVEIYYNSASTDSSMVYSLTTALLDGLESSLANRFDINRDADTSYDLATKEDITGMMFSMLMPMLLMMLLFSACMAVAPESIAGEKERGTIATLLVTPLRRSELALGKILALSIVAMASGIVSFLGVIFSLPKLMGEMDVVDATIYGVADYAWILGVILSTILLFVSLISVISAFAKSVKEATSLVSILMILVVILGVSGMMNESGAIPATPLFLIPVYNSVQAISGVFGNAYEPIAMLLTIGMNLATTSVLVWVLTRMFNSERIMFNS